MESMDHELFLIPDEKSFSTFMSIYAHACQVVFFILKGITVLRHTYWNLIFSAGAFSSLYSMWVNLEEC